jgi:hypothetical protein
MKKAGLVAMLLASIALMFSCSRNNALGPMGDDYDQSKLFEVKLLGVTSDGLFATVEIHWLTDKMSRGGSPYSFGPQDPEWTIGDIKDLSKTTFSSTGDKCYYYQAIVETDKYYGVGGGLSYDKNKQFKDFRWLTPSEQAGCPYYNPATTNMGFSVLYYGGIWYVHPGA